MELKHIDLANLAVSSTNMRGVKKVPDLSNILPSVRARGVLVPLIVRQQSCPEPVEGSSCFHSCAARGLGVRVERPSRACPEV